MIALKCKMCGGDLSVSPGASVGTCQYCGTTMTLPVTGSTQVADQFNRASGLRQGDEFDRASEVYLRLLERITCWCCNMMMSKQSSLACNNSC